MEKGLEELNALRTNQALSDEIVRHLIAYQHTLNDNRYDHNAIFERFLADEKTKIDFLDLIETEVFSLEGKRVLDAGCGKGGAAISCSLRGAASVTGFDVDSEEIDISRRRARSLNLNNVSFFEGDAANVPLPDNHYDLVIATSVLEHVNNLERTIKNLARVTNIEGYLCITSPNPIYPREAHYKVFWIPYMPKNLGRLYLKMRGFNPDFFAAHISYPYPSVSRIRKELKGNCIDPKNISERDILERFHNPGLIETASIRRVVTLLGRLRLNAIVGSLLVENFHLYPHILIYGRKVKAEN